MRARHTGWARTINLTLKRIMDLIFSLIGLCVLSPIFIAIALLIKCTSPGPIFFRQERLGQHGKIFRIVKYRTMVVNAEKMGDGLTIKSENDSRITPVGKFLRASSMDELPQLWNVLVGDMSLVGPRPPVPHYPYKYEDYNDYQRQRFSMRPGITGLAQVTVRNSASWDDRIVLDVEYIEKFNVFFDAKIICKTFQKIAIRDNIYAAEERGKGI